MNAYLSRITPDAALLAAERRHSDLTDLINDERYSDEMSERFGIEQTVVEQVLVLTRAETGEGMRAKARALQRLIYGGNIVSPKLPSHFDDDVGRLTWSLLQDILHQRALVDMIAFEAAVIGAGDGARP